MIGREGEGSWWLEAGRATWQQCASFLQRCPCALLPLGSTEQHGPHLPLSTDTIIAQFLALRTAQLSCGLVLPALPFGYSWVWRHFPGTVTLSDQTLRAIVDDVAESLHRYGCRALLLLTAHGANQAHLKYAVREIADRLPLKIAYLFYPGIDQVVKETDSPLWLKGSFHADEIETSLMLHLAPDLVLSERGAPCYPELSPDYEISSLELGALSPTGVFGDPTTASTEKGQRWLEIIARSAADQWSAFLRRHHIPHPRQGGEKACHP
ncbi:MAG: creatininase family protein [Armatimonadetes bacterium]|nr:creatininase family protein [Armatimonadota bacterium]MDW8122523.1 creatininase family protein [Armatimonadota bacterium]